MFLRIHREGRFALPRELVFEDKNGEERRQKHVPAPPQRLPALLQCVGPQDMGVVLRSKRVELHVLFMPPLRRGARSRVRRRYNTFLVNAFVGEYVLRTDPRQDRFVCLYYVLCDYLMKAKILWLLNYTQHNAMSSRTMVCVQPVILVAHRVYLISR